MKALRNERATLAQQIANTEGHLKMLHSRLQAVDESIANIEPFYEQSGVGSFSVPSSSGVTDAIRDVYRSAERNRFLSPTNVRDRLKAEGRLRGYDNEMAVIHQVIKRLMEQGQIEPHLTQKIHRWIWPQSNGMVSESKSNTRSVASVTAKKKLG